MKALVYTVIAALAPMFFVSALYSQTPPPVGGPYDPDSNTVLLLHFNGNFHDSSGHQKDAIVHGKVSFVPSDLGSSYGEMAWFNNNTRSDSSYLEIPYDSTQNLQGDWTIEGWVNFITFGQTTDDWNWRPMLIVKEWNYIMEMDAIGLQFFSPSYRAQDNTLVRITGTNGSVQAGQWYHWAYIRDSKHHVIALLVTDKSGNLVDFKQESFSPNVPPPMKTGYPIQIGIWPEGLGGGFINGFVDEIRVSNVVRNFPMPPIIKVGDSEGDPPPITHSLPNVQIPVRVEVINYAGQLTNVTLNYSTGSGFSSISMSPDTGDTYVASLPPQPAGTQIKYWISATNSLGFTANTLHSPRSDSTMCGISVWVPNTEVLDLNFENGQGTPADSSQYHQVITVHGSPTYSTDAAVGKYSMHLEGDTSYLEIQPPASFMINNEMTFDLWFKADSIAPNTAILGKYPEYHWDDWQFSYRLWFIDASHLQAEAYIDNSQAVPQRWTPVLFQDPIQTGKWYHVIWTISGKAGISYAELHDSRDSLLETESANINGYPMARAGAFRIGADYDFMPHFHGYLDGIKIYNYARSLPAVISSVSFPESYQQVANQPVTVKATVLNAANVTLYYSTGGNYTPISMTPVDSVTFQAQIPGQPLGTTVRYHVIATSSTGSRVTFPNTPPDYGIGFWQPQTQTLYLDFEEGKGAPGDSSIYHNNIIVHGNPQFSTDAMHGKYSLYLEGDSSYLEVLPPAPILASKQITLDFWFKAKTIPPFATDLLGIFPSHGSNAWAFGYRMWFKDNGQLYPEFYFVNPAGSDQRWTSPPLNYNISTMKWYHLIAEVGVDTCFAIIKDSTGAILAQAGASVQPGQYLNPVGGTFRIGHSQFDNMPYFNGWLDNIKIYNYAISLPTSVEQGASIALPEKYMLYQNYPNPFNPTTTITFDIPQRSNVRLVIYDIMGREVKTLVNEWKGPGSYRVTFDASGLASGVYFYKLVAGGFVATKKLLLIK
jgi:hypothetical protein